MKREKNGIVVISDNKVEFTMRKEYDGVYLVDGEKIVCDKDSEFLTAGGRFSKQELEMAVQGTMAWSILKAHNTSSDMENLKLKFDALVSHDMTYMGVLQTAIACGVEEFSIPFVLTNCHNSLCTMGGTLNEDDHLFGMGAVKKYGGIMVPAHQAVLHQYIREQLAGGGKMILGADSHTRYGALGTMAIGEGAGELVKQLLLKTYDIIRPPVVLVYMKGAPVTGVGPQDVALDIIRNVFKDGFVKNRIMEFAGPGIANLSVDFRNGIDVMTTESSCVSTIWQTDDDVREWLRIHGRERDYKLIRPARLAHYDYLLEVDLGKIRPMIALPFHPSNAYTIEELNENTDDILNLTEKRCSEQMKEFGLKMDLRSKIENGRLRVDQGVIAGCAGGIFENISKAADILKGKSIGNDVFQLNIYPASQPVFQEVVEKGIASKLLEAGANLRSAFCGPCFGAGDVPFNGGFSIRHTTRNFSNREGSRPKNGQLASVALMDALSIAATAGNKGFLTPATDWDGAYTKYRYYFNPKLYENRVLNCFGKADGSVELIKGPNIKDIPEIPALNDDLLLKVSAVLDDPVTTTDELIPGGESSSYRSNLLKLAEYTLSAREPQYVSRCKAVKKWEDARLVGTNPFETDGVLKEVGACLTAYGLPFKAEKTCIGSVLCSQKPGDGSAREYAATCQRVIGGWANICREYATKRYRSNLINWGILPFTNVDGAEFETESFIWIPGIRRLLESEESEIEAYVLPKNGEQSPHKVMLSLGYLNRMERKILREGCLINFYRREKCEG